LKKNERRDVGYVKKALTNRRQRFSNFLGQHAYKLFIFSLGLEGDSAVDFSKQRIIIASADVFAGMNPGAALADNNAAGRNNLAAIALYAKHFGFAVPSVSAAAYALFMSHDLSP